MNVIAKSDRGRRNNNEDRYYVSKDNRLLILADGMGGHAAGELASEIAVETIGSFTEDFANKQGEGLLDAMREAVTEANEKIFTRASEDVQLKGMGTTLSLAYLCEDFLYYINIGDSRIYYLSDHELTQLTVDDSFVNYLVHMGDITEEEAKVHPQRNILTKAMGSKRDISFDISYIPLDKLEKLLLCTDGLTDALDAHEIAEILSQDKSIELLGDQLIEQALEQGSSDNISVIILDKEW